MRRVLAILCALSLLCSCGLGKGGGKAAQTESSFPAVQLPSMLSDRAEIASYMVQHYWDGFFRLDVPTDSTQINGVPRPMVEQAVADYIAYLEFAPPKEARKSVEALFSSAEALGGRDMLGFNLLCETVSRYMYDPNSPMRNEDFYLPFVKGLSESELVADDMKPAYRHDFEMCSMNQVGQQVPDFTFRTIRGKDETLYGVSSAFTMLFFSNPGCNACKQIIDEVSTRPYIDSFISTGVLAIVNVYIDEDLEAWKEYSVNYPTNWHNGYDPTYSIREDLLFNVRAIPSLYLLDADKRVIMKDAPTEKVLNYLDRTANNL